MSKSTGRPRLGWRERQARLVRGAVLDPGLKPPGEAAPTLYESDVLLITENARYEAENDLRRKADREERMPPSEQDGAGTDAQERSSGNREQRKTDEEPTFEGTLEGIARGLGWVLSDEDLEDPIPHPVDSGSDSKRVAQESRSMHAEEVVMVPRQSGDASTRRRRITLAETAPLGKPETPPDAWRLLVEAERAGVRGIGLNHIITTDAAGANPFTGNPFTGNPFTGNPFTGNPFTGNPFTGNPAGGLGGYAVPGLGGRQPVAFVGADLPPVSVADEHRPVVAILDTGCGTHPWLEGRTIEPDAWYGGPLGVVDGETDPDRYTSLDSPLDGVVDSAAGHGTFIAGIVVQACPDALILPVRVADSQGVIMENDLLGALGRMVEKKKNGGRLDVVNLSFGFYHEAPSASHEAELYKLLYELRSLGVVIVCSAGNDATDRPAAPASLHHWSGEDCGIGEEGDVAPLVTVGALNPSGRSVALFSNIGDWVQTFVRGVSVVSTIPTNFQGGVQADLRSDEYDRQRETLDLDDFTSGFAVWSGTSFAAPLVAGRIAAKLTALRSTASALAGDAVAAAISAKDGALQLAKDKREDKSLLTDAEKKVREEEALEASAPSP